MKEKESFALFALLALSIPAGAQAEAGDQLERLTLPRFSYPTWSADGQKILYESNTSGDWEIYIMDADGLTDDGGKIVRLTRNPATDRMPAWSPDGAYIAFLSNRDGEFEVFRMKPDGSEQIQLTFNDEPDIHPYWTPDSTHIIHNRRVSTDPLLYAIYAIYAVYAVDHDGGEVRQILKDDELNSYAQMSPGGQWIVFDKWQDNDQENGEIYVMRPDGSELRRLTESPGVYDGYPTWLDGDTILFSSEVDGVFKLFSIDVDGTGLQQLTFGPGNDQRADVSPDGTRVVFNRTIDENVNIYVLALDP